jgi:multicomponent Na+:H+ antiporter subunit D
MVMGIGLAAHDATAHAAVAATVFYVVHHIIVKSSLFLSAGIAEAITGTRRLQAMGGVMALAPGAALLFLVGALSLAGMPPFSGFLAKLVVLRVGLADGRFVVVAVAVATSFLTLVSMSKIWAYAYWGPPQRLGTPIRWHGPAAATSVLVGMTVLLGLFAEPFLRLADDTARDVVDPAAYVRAVLGERHAAAGAVPQ